MGGYLKYSNLSKCIFSDLIFCQRRMEKCIASAYTLPAATERGRTMLLTSDDEHKRETDGAGERAAHF